MSSTNFHHIVLFRIRTNRADSLHAVVCARCFMHGWFNIESWWRHQMETFSALLAILRGIHRSPMNSPHKGQWRGALMFSLTCVWINGWVNNREAGDLGRHRAHYDVTVMIQSGPCPNAENCPWALNYGSAEGPPRGVENRNLLSHPDDLRMEAYVIRMT